MNKPKYAVVAVHGIGTGGKTARAGFSKDLEACVDVNCVIWKEAVWEGLNDAIDSEFSSWVAQQIGRLTIGPVGWDETVSFWSNMKRLFCWSLRVIVKLFGRNIATAAFDLGDDYFLYLLTKRGAEIREEVRRNIEVLHAREKLEIVLVAHSLGSLIAYDVLAEAELSGNPLPVRALVTFGSPIEWSFKLRRFLRLKEREFQKIGKVLWENYYYKEDLVPLHRPILDGQLAEVSNADQCLEWHKDSNLPAPVDGLVSHCDYWKDSELAAQIRALVLQ